MATVPVQITWVVGQVVTAAQLNANVRDAVNFLLAPPMAELRQTVQQSIPTGGSGAALLFDAEDLDRDNGHSTVTNTSRYTAQTPGWYQGSGGGSSFVGAGRRTFWWNVNGTSLNASEAGLTAGPAATAPAARTKQMFMNIGDYLELIMWQDTGGAINTFTTGTAQPGMSIRWVSN